MIQKYCTAGKYNQIFRTTYKPYMYFQIFDYILLARSFLTCKISKSLKKITMQENVRYFGQ